MSDQVDLREKIEKVFCLQKTRLKSIGDYVEITTPYLDRHNDYIQIFVSKDKDGLLLTDDGYVLVDLRENGWTLQQLQEIDFFQAFLESAGIRIDEGELIRGTSSEKDFPKRLQNFVALIVLLTNLPAQIRQMGRPNL